MRHGQTTDTASNQGADVILDLAILHRHLQGLAIEIFLEGEHRHLQRVPSRIAQLQGHVVVPPVLQEVSQHDWSRDR